jgi:hypothetical protein
MSQATVELFVENIENAPHALKNATAVTDKTKPTM